MQPAVHAVTKSPTLREGHRRFTRARICDTAREVFRERGFAAATMEQIAAAGGIGRSTLYNHFHDKDQILAAIAEDYAPGLCALPKLLTSSAPTRSEIDIWLLQVTAFVAKERTPTVLLNDLGSSVDSYPCLQLLGRQLMQALALRLPAFKRALEPGPDRGMAFARATVLLREIGLAALQYIAHNGQGHGRDRLAVAGEMLDRFLNGEK